MVAHKNIDLHKRYVYTRKLRKGKRSPNNKHGQPARPALRVKYDNTLSCRSRIAHYKYLSITDGFRIQPLRPTFGIAFANIPDIDGLASLRRIYNHHNALKHVSHYPANWCIVFDWSQFCLFLPYPVFLCLPEPGNAQCIPSFYS